MKKVIIFVSILFILTGCAYFRPHKIDIEQGNLFTQQDINKLHPGMSITQVKKIMGTPIMTNLFNENRVDYVYTFQAGGKNMQIQRVICIFKNGILQRVITQQ